jgi:hypothetical protein
MSHWSFWDWVGYTCIFIAAIGLALSALPERTRSMFESWPIFTSPNWSFMPAILLVVATIIFIVRLFASNESKPLKAEVGSAGAPPINLASAPTPLIADSQLTLHTYGDARWPTRISETNVWRYFYLRNVLTIIGNNGEKREIIFPNLFLVFDKPANSGTVDVSSPDFKLPKHTSHDLNNNRYVIITFEEDLPAGTLEIRVH